MDLLNCKYRDYHERPLRGSERFRGKDDGWSIGSHLETIGPSVQGLEIFLAVTLGEGCSCCLEDRCQGCC